MFLIHQANNKLILKYGVHSINTCHYEFLPLFSQHRESILNDGNPTPANLIFFDNKKVLAAVPATHLFCIVYTNI